MSAIHRRKRLGQHFLTDAQVIDDIITLISPRANQTIVEIGPGPGALTHRLAASDAELHAIEIDPALIQELQQQFSDDSMTLHHADALKFDYSSVRSKGKDLRIVGNLPYSISTPLMLRLVQFADIIHDMCFMVQYEVAKRLAAECGTHSYGRLTVCVARTFEVESVFDVEPYAFSPPPEVRSSVIVMRPKPLSMTNSEKECAFSELVRLAFGKRRKTLRNALSGAVDDAVFEQAGVDAGLRAENLSVEDYLRLAECVFSRARNTEEHLMQVHD